TLHAAVEVLRPVSAACGSDDRVVATVAKGQGMSLKLSVVIPAFNHLSEVLACLTSLQTFASKQIPIEFIVADDCSNEVFLPAVIPHCAAKVVRRDTNGGFGVNAN